MEESEKMTALKKAYAEIILNTAKEAATRIMVSERKAQQVHHDLSSTKEEALRLLLRLKQTMDSKINEAEMKSLNQQRRIEELEAQLHEAEDIVSNLREELNEAHTKLEEIAKNQIHSGPNMIEKVVYEAGITQLENGNSVNWHSAPSNSFQEYGSTGDPNVPTIIMRSKDPELYRNGCTQRIRAYEGNLLNGHFSRSEEVDNLKNGKTSREYEEVKNLKKNNRRGQPVKSFRRKRKRAARYRSNASILKPIPPLAEEEHSDLFNSQTCLSNSLDMLKRRINEDKSSKSHSHSVAPSIISDIGVPSEHVEIPRGDDGINEAQTDTMNEDNEVASSLVLINCLDNPNSNTEPEMKNASLMNLDAKTLDTGDGFPSPQQKERVLKYTFQRKRKKESVSCDDQEKFLRRKSGKKQNDSLEPPKSSIVADSSRDSRRMAQVARQLISLSEKKWWK